MEKITYTNKVALNDVPSIADINKCKASDLNEIKNVVNTNADDAGNIIIVGDETEATEDTKLIIEEDDMNLDLQGSDFLNEYSESTEKGYSCDYINTQLDNKQNGVWTLLQDDVDKGINVDLSNIDFNEIYVVIRNVSDIALAITQNVIKSDLTDTTKWYRNGYYYNAQVNSAVAVRASLTQISFTDYYVNGSIANAKMTVYYR